MRIKTVAVSGVVVAAVAIIAAYMITLGVSEDADVIQDTKLFHYDSNADIRRDLSAYDIEVSEPLVLYDDRAAQYCTFFVGSPPEPYCTSTEITYDGRFLGNIHMIGNDTQPVTALAVIQSDDRMTEILQISAVWHVMIENLVCDCWAEVRPGGFNTINDWIDMAAMIQLGTHSTVSRTEGLPVGVMMEITPNESGHVWTLLIGSLP